MKKLLSAVAFFMLAAYSYAYDITIHAVDADGNDEVYATCSVFTLNDLKKPALAGVTDSLGCYKAELDSAGTYRLHVEAAGGKGAYQSDFTLTPEQPSYNFGDVVLGSVDQLDEVLVTAQRPLVTKKLDRICYDVQADPEVLTLTTREMLRNVPLISVDAEGNISINGSSNFKVFKNGRPNNSYTKNAKEILEAIPASMIKSIEVITEPGAKYDAEGIGAILNIITVENSAIKGVLGNARFSYNAYAGNISASAYITTQIDKVTLSFNGGAYSVSKKVSRSHSESELHYNNGITETSVGESETKGWTENFSVEGSWEPNKRNLVSLEFSYFDYNVKPSNTTSTARRVSSEYGGGGTLLSSYTSSTNSRRDGWMAFNGNINYQYTTNRKDELLTASYAVSSTAQRSDITTTYDDVVGDLFSYSALNGTNNLHFIEHTFQADWTRPIGDIHTVELGGKYILRRNTSDGDNEYVDWETLHNEFKHITDVGAFYAQYTAKLKKVSLRAGLRYEYSKLKAEYPDGSAQAYSSTFNDIVPSASMSWNVSDVHSLSLSYAGRVNRPGIEYLNPTVMYTPTTISQGNPDLESAFRNSTSIRYMFIKRKFNFNVSASYVFNNDNIVPVNYVDNDGMIHNTYGNVGFERGFSLSGYTQWSVTNKTRIMFNGTLSYVRRKQERYELFRWYPMLFLRVWQELPFKVNMNVGLSHYNMGVYSVYTYSRNESAIPVSWDISLSRYFLKDRRLSVSITASDCIGNRFNKFVTYRVNGDYTGYNFFRSNKKRIALTLSYRFGSLNAYVKKTSKSIQNDDLVGGASK